MIKTTIYFIVLMAVAYLFNYLHSIINNNNIKSDKKYYKRKYMSDCELNFYNKIKELENEEYKVIPQVNLATIITKENKSFQGELFRNIDFAIFDKNFQNLLLLIELNDSSHKKSSRIKRDIKVKKICDSANIKLITFYTNFANEKDYVINRIKKEILAENTKIDSEVKS